MDVDRWMERAAIMEFDGGLSRFEAETKAAAEQGVLRREARDAARRALEQARDQRAAMAQRTGANDVPGMQRGAAEENRPVPVGQRG